MRLFVRLSLLIFAGTLLLTVSRSFAAIPPKISGMTSGSGYQTWPPAYGQNWDDNWLDYIGSRYGMVRTEFQLIEGWLNPNQTASRRADMIAKAGHIASILDDHGSWLLLELKVDGTVDNLDTQYASFCRGMADALWKAGHRNIIIELSNEPNIDVPTASDPVGLDNPETYAIVANAAASSIRAVSSYLICTGGISQPVRPNQTGPYSWAEHVMSRIDWSKVSFFGYHAYGTSSTGPEKIDGYYLDECVQYMRGRLANYAPGKSVDVLMTEMSWDASVTDDATRSALYARTSLIGIRNAVESSVWFPWGAEIPAAGFKAAQRLKDDYYGFNGNPKTYASVTGNSLAVGVSITNIYADTVGRNYSSLGQIRVALWLPVRGAGSTQNANLSIPSGYPYAYYNKVDASFAPTRLTVTSSKISNFPVSGMPNILYLVKSPYRIAGIDYLSPVSNELIMTSGQVGPFSLQIENTGFESLLNSGANAVRIVMNGDGPSFYNASAWQSQTISGYLKEASVAPGRFGTFEFTMKAPTVTEETTYEVIIGADRGAGQALTSHLAHYDITVLPAANSPSQPVNLQPSNGATDVSLQSTLIGSSYSHPSGTGMKAGLWQISANEDFSQMILDAIKSGAETQYPIPDGILDYNTTYYWRVQYQDNSDNWSPFSTATYFTTTSVPTSPPTAPTSLTAVPLNISQIRLAWMDNSANEDGFIIESKTGKTWSQIATVGSNIATYTSSGLLAGTKHSYRVKAYNSGYISNYSNAASAKTFALTAPSNLTATAVSSTQVNLSWNDNSSDERGFKLERRIGTTGKWSKLKTAGMNITSYSDIKAKSGTQYYYRVRAYKSGGYSDYSNEASAITF
jgi:hypothetical protein